MADKVMLSCMKLFKTTVVDWFINSNRGFEFLLVAIEASNKNESEELVTSFTNSYNATLKKHHNFVVKGLIGVALKATPYRATFYKQLALGNDDEKTLNDVNADAKEWIKSLESNVEVIKKFQETPGARF